MESVLVLGAGGFIGSHMVERLKERGFWVRGVDQKLPEYADTAADDFVLGDLRQMETLEQALDRRFDEVYQFAADMGGAGYVFTGEHDADIISNNALMNINVCRALKGADFGKVLFSSSACIYPFQNQADTEHPTCVENSAYPANPDSEYGWEKLFSERVYSSFKRNYGMDSKIVRFHNIFGPKGAWDGGREKAPAALCRKVAQIEDGGEIEVWGDGLQTRSFLYIEECLEGVERLMASDFSGPLNIGSEEMISINDLTRLIMDIAGKSQSIKNIDGPQGVRGRRSDNTLIYDKLGWKPTKTLRSGLEKTYAWIREQVEDKR